jgi:aryl-alcohol dehydrogenase-like predicted oxidoreductase
MDYRQLGDSGLRVSEISLGTMSFGASGADAAVIGSVDLSVAKQQVDRCLDEGVNLFDTADVYAGGASEEVLGQVIRGRRNRLLIATKARFSTGPGPNDGGLSRHHLIAACERSLQRLGIDHIDLYQVHQWDGQTPVEETLAALDRLVQDGKVRYIGCSNFSAWHLGKSLSVSGRLGLERYICQQIHYSLVAREAEYELVPLGLDAGLGLLVWSPLAGGLLSGRYRRDHQTPEGTRVSMGWDEPPVRDWELLWQIVDALIEIADEHNASPAQVSLRFLLDRPGVTSVIVGARDEGQLLDNLRTIELRLSEQAVRRLEELTRPPLLYPYWHQARNASERLSAADLSLLEPYRDVDPLAAPNGLPPGR